MIVIFTVLSAHSNQNQMMGLKFGNVAEHGVARRTTFRSIGLSKRRPRRRKDWRPVSKSYQMRRWFDAAFSKEKGNFIFDHYLPEM